MENMKFYLEILKTEVRKRRKAIAAALAPLVSVWLLKVGLDVDDDTLVLLITTGITALTVHTVPNER